jgi:putative PIN family toxin of toxin-antitoxin system
MKLVLDTNVLVTAMRSPAGAAAEVIRLVRQRQIVAVVSVALFVEYEAVLKRPEHLMSAKLSEKDIDTVLDVLAAVGERVEPYFLWRPRLRDPNDDMVLETAVNGRAEGITTFNIRDFREAVHDFGIAVLTPADVLRRI